MRALARGAALGPTLRCVCVCVCMCVCVTLQAVREAWGVEKYLEPETFNAEL